MKLSWIAALALFSNLAFAKCELYQVAAAHLANYDLQENFGYGKLVPSASGKRGVLVSAEWAQIWDLKKGSSESLLPTLTTNSYNLGRVTMAKNFEGLWQITSRDSQTFIEQVDIQRGNVLLSRPWHGSDGTPLLLNEYHLLAVLPAVSPHKRFMEIWDTQSFERVVRIVDPTPAEIAALAFSPKDKTLALAFTNEMGRLIDVTTGQTLSTIPGDWTSSAFSHDGKFFAATYKNGGMNIFEAHRGTLSASLDGNQIYPFRQVMFHPEQSRIIFVNEGSRLSRSKNVGAFLTREGTIDFDGSTILSMATSADGARIVTALSSSELILWDSQSLKPLMHFVGPKSGVVDLFFSPEGERLVATTLGGEVAIWNLPSSSNQDPSASTWSAGKQEIQWQTTSDRVVKVTVTKLR